MKSTFAIAKLFSTIACLLLSGLCLGQQKQMAFDPKILILSPAKTTVAPELQKQFALQADTIARMVAEAAKVPLNPTPDGQPENLTQMLKNTRDYSAHLDFFKMAPLVSGSYLGYRFFER